MRLLYPSAGEPFFRESRAPCQIATFEPARRGLILRLEREVIRRHYSAQGLVESAVVFGNLDAVHSREIPAPIGSGREIGTTRP